MIEVFYFTIPIYEKLQQYRQSHRPEIILHECFALFFYKVFGKSATWLFIA